jgi:hypothetical protein
MKVRFHSQILIGAVLCANSVLAQQATPVAVPTLQSSLSAMVGQVAIQDATLSGTAEVIAGSSDQTVSVVLESLAAGPSRIDLNLSSGVQSEISLIGVSGSTSPSGTWTSGDGVQHPIAQHNLLTDSAWFFPPLVVQRMLANPLLTVIFVGQEGNLLHFQSYQSSNSPSTDRSPTLQHLTQMDLYLSSTTLQPTQFSFNTHADNDATMDIPVVVQFQDYQTVNGVTMPFHVQRFVNNSLVLDLKIQAATFNAGLTLSAISAQ